METIRKTESKIGKNDEPSHIPMQMPRPQATSTRRARKVTKRLEQELIRDRIHNNRWTSTPVRNLEQTHPVPGKNINDRWQNPNPIISG